MQREFSRVNLKGLKEANYYTLDCHGISFPDFNRGKLNDLTLDHTQREINGLQKDLDIEVKRTMNARAAAEVYGILLKSLLSEEEMDVEFLKESKGRFDLMVRKCDFSGACPKAPNCLCLRGCYIKDAMIQLGPARSGKVEFISLRKGDCHISIDLDMNIDQRVNEKLSVENDSYLRELEESVRKAPRKKREKFHLDHFSRGMISSAQDTLPPEQFKAFAGMFKLQMRELRTSGTGRRNLILEMESDRGKSRDPSGGPEGNIISCPRCGSFINRDKNRTCFNCGYVVIS